MEVHAHTHTERKKFTHYLWEFLMLFLAVFCGFLAENQREHYVEHQREKKYARQLLSDLRTDSIFFIRVINVLDTMITGYKKFESIMNSPSSSNYDILYAYLQLQSTFSMRPTTTTYSEMKSSGSLRYIRNDELTIQLKKYYEGNLNYLKDNEELGNDLFKTQIQPFTINHFRIADMDVFNNKLRTTTPLFVNWDKVSQMQCLNIMGLYNIYIVFYNGNAVKPAAKKVNSIIEMLKKEYHLE